MSAAVESAWPRYPDYRIDLVPCRGTARVRVGDVVLADSPSALRLIETDHVERLYIPARDVRLDLMESSEYESVCPFKGRASYWSFKGEPTVDDLFWTYKTPFDEVAGILGYIGVYHEKASIEISTEWSDGEVAVCRFPAWGDQTDLVAGLDPQPSGPGLFVAPGYHEKTRNVVEGGQLIGQAIVAASRTATDQRVTWAAATFARAANFDSPIDLSVEDVHRGRTFSTLSVRSAQEGRTVAPSLVLLDSGAADVIRGVAAMPAVPEPSSEQSVPYDMRVIGRDVRVVGGVYGQGGSYVGPPEIHAWVRFRDDTAELALRQALVAQATTHWTIAAAMLPHPGISEALAHESLSTAPMALTVAFHDDAPLDEWMLYSTNAIWSGSGLVQGEGRIYTRRGGLLASYSLQAMVRDRLSSAGARDASSAM